MTENKDPKKSVDLFYLPLLFSLLLFPLTDTWAQNTLIKAGINVSSVAGVAEKSSMIGYHIGIGGMKPVLDKVALKYELVFSQQGSQVTDDDRLVFYYLNMPILLNMRSGGKFSFDVGPQLGLALNAFEKRERERDITANLNTFDISLCLGVNYLISERFFAEGRFNLGLTNVSRISDTNSQRNTVFQGSVGYYFNRKNEHPE